MQGFFIRTRVFLLLIIIGMMIFSICGCSFIFNFMGDSISEKNEPDDKASMYDKIYNTMMAGNSEVEFKSVSSEDLQDVYDSVLLEHPEIFWVSSGYSYKELKNDEETDIQLIMNIDNSLYEKRETFNLYVDDIISNLAPFENEYDAVVKIHDYILDNTEYDKQAYDEILSNINKKKVYSETSAYGCLCEGQAVCSGYSAAMQLLLQKIGFESGRISGDKVGGGSHQWNYVKLSNDYYYIDTTWDDTVSYDGKKTYDFFCITTDELKKTHIIGENKFIPECNSEVYDYYKYHNFYLEEYDYHSAANIIISSGGIIKFSSKAEADRAIEDLIKNQKIYSIISAKEIRYYRSGWDNILHFII